MDLKIRFRAVKLGGGNLLFIDIMSKSWVLNENNAEAQDCAMWQDLIGWKTSSSPIICCHIIGQYHINIFRSNRILPQHRLMSRHSLMPYQYFFFQ